MPDSPEITGVSIFVGVIAGALLSVACLVLALFLGSVMHTRPYWIFPAMNGVLLLVAGLVAFRSYRFSGIARGIVIAVALAFALNGLCGAALIGLR
jgi:hypothetical protein